MEVRKGDRFTFLAQRGEWVVFEVIDIVITVCPWLCVTTIEYKYENEEENHKREAWEFAVLMREKRIVRFE